VCCYPVDHDCPALHEVTPDVTRSRGDGHAAGAEHPR